MASTAFAGASIDDDRPGQAAEIRRLHFAERWKAGTIATQLGLRHDAVERVLGLGKGERPRQGGALAARGLDA